MWIKTPDADRIRLGGGLRSLGALVLLCVLPIFVSPISWPNALCFEKLHSSDFRLCICAECEANC